MLGHLLLSGLLALACAAAPLPEVPYIVVQINGTQSQPTSSVSASYRAYQASTSDGFRILCPNPCGVDAAILNAKYAGLKAARQQLLALVGGVDVVAGNSPFDYHIMSDTWCGNYQPGYTGVAGTYPDGGSFGCFWDKEKLDSIYPLTVENAQRIEAQLLFVHEYGHVLFYSRHHMSYEDLVKAFSILVSGINNVAPGQADFCNPSVGSYAPLVHELCQRNRFRNEDFAAVMRELDRVFQAGLGTAFAGAGGKPITTVHTFKRILDAHLGSDTRDAFLARSFTPYQVGADAILPAAGGTVSMVGGAVVLEVPAGAVTADTPVTLDIAYGAPYLNGQALPFKQMFRLLPETVAFSRSVRLTVHYTTVEGTESALRLWKLNGAYPSATTWSEAAGRQLDTAAHTISGTISGTGQFVYVAQ